MDLGMYSAVFHLQGIYNFVGGLYTLEHFLMFCNIKILFMHLVYLAYFVENSAALASILLSRRYVGMPVKLSPI